MIRSQPSILYSEAVLKQQLLPRLHDRGFGPHHLVCRRDCIIYSLKIDSIIQDIYTYVCVYIYVHATIFPIEMRVAHKRMIVLSSTKFVVPIY